MDGFMSVKEAAQKWNVSERQVQLYCKNGIIPNVSRIGRSWVIPADTQKPVYRFITPTIVEEIENKERGETR